MHESLVAAFLGGLGIGVSAGFSFQIGTAIAKYLARKNISSDTASLGHESRK